MVDRMEQHPAEAPDGVHVSLLEWAAVHSTRMRSSVDAMARKAGWDPRRGSFAHWATTATATASPSPTAVHIPPLVDNEAVRSVSAVAHLDSDPDRRVELEAKFERAFLDKVDRAVAANAAEGEAKRPEVQMWTCIDDREGSLRRHVEARMAENVETFGVAGFFGLPFRYRSATARTDIVLAPEGVQPAGQVVETDAPGTEGAVDKYARQATPRRP